VLGEKDMYRDGRYKDNNPTWHAEDGSGKAEDLLTAVRKALAGREGAGILEVGCGTGSLLSALRAAIGSKQSYTGIDIAPEPIRLGTEQHSGIELHVQDFLSFQEHVTVAIFGNVFEHLEHPENMLRSDVGLFLGGELSLSGCGGREGSPHSGRASSDPCRHSRAQP
jgi:2-polyprenyl-3-methyl-5-hydroxy-6-metoxy-1,4-benzoquinol methylase